MAASLLCGAASCAEPGPIDRAIDFLSREVPRWSAENKCYSCHNNGDAARALFTAKQQGREISEKTLADTTAWLIKPEAWEHNGGDGEFNDRTLATIQFAHSLLTAVETGAVTNKAPLAQAARMVAKLQDDDGSWTIEPKSALGAPATYGGPLATAISLRVLAAADAPRFRKQIDAGHRRMRELRTTSMVDTSGVLLGLAGVSGEAASKQRRDCLERLLSAQGDLGGWGPYASAPPEPFDTAIALLALAEAGDFPGRVKTLDRGRRFLIGSQLSDGSWPETTRPARSVSYAQRLSTTGWCTLALLATDEN
jgi:hypothetical protein